MGLHTDDILELFRDVHRKLRNALGSIEDDLINWRPGIETNSVGSLVEHVVRSERRNLQRAVGSELDPPAQEFGEKMYRREELLELLEAADAFLDATQGSLSPAVLERVVAHPHRGPSSALVLVLQTYGHVKEHLGHFDLTWQLGIQYTGGAHQGTPLAAPGPERT